MPSAPAQTLRVVANPYAAVDHHGNPSSALLLDPDDHLKYVDVPEHPDPSRRWQTRQYVGATVKPGATVRPVVRRRLKNRVHVTPARVEHHFEFSADAVSVPNTEYYRRAIKTGHVFAADLASYIAAGGAKASFQEPAMLLAWSKEGAIARHVAHHGKDADDPRLQRLALHWDGQVEQRHPLGKAVSAKAKADAEAKAAPETAAAQVPAPAASASASIAEPQAQPASPSAATKPISSKGV